MVWRGIVPGAETVGNAGVDVPEGTVVIGHHHDVCAEGVVVVVGETLGGEGTGDEFSGCWVVGGGGLDGCEGAAGVAGGTVLVAIEYSISTESIERFNSLHSPSPLLSSPRHQLRRSSRQDLHITLSLHSLLSLLHIRRSSKSRAQAGDSISRSKRARENPRGGGEWKRHRGPSEDAVRRLEKFGGGGLSGCQERLV